MLTSVWAAHIQVPTGPCDGMLELRRSYGVQRQLSPLVLMPVASFSSLPKARIQRVLQQVLIIPYSYSISLFLECLVWNTDLLASGLSLASQGHTNQRLRAHTLTSEDARDRVGLDAILSFNPSKTSIMELWLLTNRGASENELLKRVFFP